MSDCIVRNLTGSTELYACINIADPMVAWETAVGRFSSGVSKTPDGFGISLWTHKMLSGYGPRGPSKRVLRELRLERVRQRTAPSSVARLDGLYLFQSETDARRAIERWEWSADTHRLSSVHFWPSSTSIYDSEWITEDILGDDESWMPRYWRGEARGADPILEVLARGVGMIDNNDLRREAYERMSRGNPLSSKLLAFSAAAFWYGCDTAGQVKPGVLITKDGIASQYAIYMKDFETGSGLDMEAALRMCEADGAVFPYDGICDELSTITVPDFRGCNVEISNPVLRDVALAIHGDR